MLTQQDLQNIRALIRDEVNHELKPISTKLSRLAKDVSYIIKSFDERITQTEKALQKLQNN